MARGKLDMGAIPTVQAFLLAVSVRKPLGEILALPATWSNRRLGELIRAAQEGKLVAEKGRPKKGHDAPLKLKDLGVSLDASKRSQRLVDVPAEKIAAYTNATKASGDDRKRPEALHPRWCWRRGGSHQGLALPAWPPGLCRPGTAYRTLATPQETKVLATKTAGRPKEGKVSHDATLKLSDINLSRDQSARAQRLVDVPAEEKARHDVGLIAQARAESVVDG